MFRTVPMSIIRSFPPYTQQWCMSYRFVDKLSSRIRMDPTWSYSSAVYKPVCHIPLLSVQWVTPDDGHRNCPKHVEFHFQGGFERLVPPFGFVTKNPDWYVGLYISVVMRPWERHLGAEMCRCWRVTWMLYHRLHVLDDMLVLYVRTVMTLAQVHVRSNPKYFFALLGC
jgi:hypothetical protein